MAIAIPRPVSGDSEKMVSSLENAALFGRIGDHEEALRWVQKAAELASESGDDERTLVLAQTAAELCEAGNRSEDVVNALGKRLPKPPGRPPVPDASPLATVKRPSPPSSRPPDQRPPSSGANQLPPPSSRANESPKPAATTSEAPRSSKLRPPPKPRASVSAPAPSTRAAPSPPAPSALEPALADSLTPASPTPLAVVARARSAAAVSTAPRAPARPGHRPAARVSVERSTTEPGVYFVRLLEDGRAPPRGQREALLVALDPSSDLL